MALLVDGVDALLTLLALLLLVPVGVLTLQLLLARPGGAAAAVAAGRRPRLAVVMPAHNEAAGIAEPIAALRAQLAPGDRLLVVADNCSDATAAVAAAAGAQVSERFDSVRRGKGYALDHGVRQLEADPPEVVLIVDADCIVEPGALDRLARECAAHGRPIQALYRMLTPEGAGLRMRVAQFAWRVKGQARALGYRRLGLPCQLMGTGMAFPWAQIVTAPLASGHLVEDLQLGLDLAAAGHAPRYCVEAVVTSSFPSSDDATASQRTRWEHGHLGVIAAQGPRLLWRALRERNGALAALTLDLCVPPLSFLVLLLGGMLAAGALFALASGERGPLALAALSALLMALGIGAAWQRFGRDALSLGELLGIPLYVLAKLPMYARLLVARQTQWVRTGRDKPRPPDRG
ncbi:MAG TPA: glycosyltransferase [Methylibium sp.]|nr:glycosyltransferase [Methylibium sp.]